MERSVLREVVAGHGFSNDVSQCGSEQDIGQVVVAPIDVGALRHERRTRVGHHLLSQLRTEAYPVYGRRFFPPGRWTDEEALDVEKTRALCEEAKEELARGED